MTGVPMCWNCPDKDFDSSGRRIWCRKCGANLWYFVSPEMGFAKMKPGRTRT